jgi:hypothetical protein
MFYALRKLYRPEFYQGPDRLARYFEGWYYKAVADGSPFALIPGVSRAPDSPHAFIQYSDGVTGASTYHRFDLNQFSYRRDRFEIRIGDNRFSLSSYEVDLPEISCELKLQSTHGWPSTLLSPGTMGWYSFVPFMECRHGIIVMDAVLSGTLNGSPIGQGRLYMEKDYGRSFPNAWVWLQSNSFAGSDGTSVTCSIANVPFAGGAFTGFLAGILCDGELYRFTTYTGARLRALDLAGNSVSIRLEDRRKSLDIVALREDGAVLASPENGAMSGRISETLASTVTVTLTVDGSERFSGTGRNAGLEVVNAEALT